jgi:glutamine synthetase
MDQMTERELEAREKLPRTLYEAVQRFQKDYFLQDVLGEHISRHLIETKDQEWDEYCKQVTVWEMERYLGTV